MWGFLGLAYHCSTDRARDLRYRGEGGREGGRRPETNTKR
jgi:hypothetical protein